MAAKDQSRGERPKRNSLLQNFKIAHKHIKMSSITKEPLAELTTEASQIPMVKILEGWFLNEIFLFSSRSRKYICEAYLRSYQRMFSDPF